jgi:hypothetical protein
MAAKKLDLGENKTISVLTFEDDGLQLHLGAVILVPTEYDKRLDKTYYKPVGVKTPITAEQRDQIIVLLGGIPPCQKH